MAHAQRYESMSMAYDPEADGDTILLDGWLKKDSGKTFGGKKKRWFVLYNNKSFKYFTDKKKTTIKGDGSFFGVQQKDVKVNGANMEIVGKGRDMNLRLWKLTADSSSEANQWVQYILAEPEKTETPEIIYEERRESTPPPPTNIAPTNATTAPPKQNLSHPTPLQRRNRPRAATAQTMEEEDLVPKKRSIDLTAAKRLKPHHSNKSNIGGTELESDFNSPPPMMENSSKRINEIDKMASESFDEFEEPESDEATPATGAGDNAETRDSVSTVYSVHFSTDDPQDDKITQKQESLKRPASVVHNIKPKEKISKNFSEDYFNDEFAEKNDSPGYELSVTQSTTDYNKANIEEFDKPEISLIQMDQVDESKCTNSLTAMFMVQQLYMQERHQALLKYNEDLKKRRRWLNKKMTMKKNDQSEVASQNADILNQLQEKSNKDLADVKQQQIDEQKESNDSIDKLNTAIANRSRFLGEAANISKREVLILTENPHGGKKSKTLGKRVQFHPDSKHKHVHTHEDVHEHTHVHRHIYYDEEEDCIQGANSHDAKNHFHQTVARTKMSSKN